MTVDIEAGGALATAGLAASVIDGQAGKPQKGYSGNCANCGTALAGSYCHACGQIGHVHRSIWHMIEEGLHGLLHFDSKTWRTLPLLIARPGLLTRRYIDGQRVRYVQPLALFLFTMFLMFFVFSFASEEPPESEADSKENVEQVRSELLGEVGKAQGRVSRLEARLARTRNADDREQVTDELSEAKEELQDAQTGLSVFDKAVALGTDPDKPTTMTAKELENLASLDVGNTHIRLPGNAWPELLKNRELAAYKFKNTAYKFSFMLIPISLPFMWLMFFWRKGVTAYDHIVFSLYSLSFMSLWFIALVLLSKSSFTEPIVPFLFFIPPIHIFLQLRTTYGLGMFSTLWRTIALLVSAGTASLLFVIAIAALSSM